MVASEVSLSDQIGNTQPEVSRSVYIFDLSPFCPFSTCPRSVPHTNKRLDFEGRGLPVGKSPRNGFILQISGEVDMVSGGKDLQLYEALRGEVEDACP